MELSIPTDSSSPHAPIPQQLMASSSSSTSPQHEKPETRYKTLRKRTQAFCDAFLDLPNNPPWKLLGDHFTSFKPRITEHGPPWAAKRLPFLGRTFIGYFDCTKYFELLNQTLEFLPREGTFGPKESYIVDERATSYETGARPGGVGKGMVSVKGKATFKAVATGKTWEEEFIYRLSDFDEDGKIG